MYSSYVVTLLFLACFSEKKAAYQDMKGVIFYQCLCDLTQVCMRMDQSKYLKVLIYQLIVLKKIKNSLKEQGNFVLPQDFIYKSF